MTKGKIVYEGIHCFVKAKAAFMVNAMKQGLISPMEIRKALEVEKCCEDLSFSQEGGNVITTLVNLGERDLELAFDRVVGAKLLKCQDTISEDQRIYLQPVMEMEHREVRVESFCYLIHAVVKNERCRQELNRVTEPERDRYYQAYRESAYCDSPFLYRFLKPHKKAARMAIGMLELLRREGNRQDEGAEEENLEYRRFMGVLYAGYRPVKNMVKRFRQISGEDLRGFGNQDGDMVDTLSRTVVAMVMAQDLQIFLEVDYFFYVMLRMLRFYDGEWMGEAKKLEPSGEAKESLRQIRRKYQDFGSFHRCYYLQPDVWNGITGEEMLSGSDYDRSEVADGEEKPFTELEQLFLQYQLSLRMLSDIHLDRSEVEQLFAVFGPMEVEQFGWRLLTATLCKYIASLHAEEETEQAEELVYQRDEARKERERTAAEVLRLTLQLGVWEGKWKEADRQLTEKEREREKLQERLRQLEQKRKGEREELNRLREFVYEMGRAAEQEEEASSWNGTAMAAEEKASYGISQTVADIPAVLAGEKVLVVGGHQKWQKKMRQLLPDGIFLASDHRNFDSTVLQNRKYIIMNTDVLKHSIYYRIMAEKRQEQQVLYVHGSNMKRCFQELGRQIRQQS